MNDVENDKNSHNIVNDSFAHKPDGLLVTWEYHITHWLAAEILPLLVIFECRNSNLESVFFVICCGHRSFTWRWYNNTNQPHRHFKSLYTTHNLLGTMHFPCFLVKRNIYVKLLTEQFSRKCLVRLFRIKCLVDIGECMYTHVSAHNKILNIYNTLGLTCHQKTASFSSSTT